MIIDSLTVSPPAAARFPGQPGWQWDPGSGSLGLSPGRPGLSSEAHWQPASVSEAPCCQPGGTANLASLNSAKPGPGPANARPAGAGAAARPRSQASLAPAACQ